MILITIVLLLGFGLAYAGNYLVNYALKIDKSTHLYIQDDPEKELNALTSAYLEWYPTADAEEISITSNDGLKLWAKQYHPETPTNNYVLAIHGYTSNHSYLGPAVMPFVLEGFNVISPDTRAHLNSEGQYITMGYHESDDVLLWIDKILEMDPSANIILYGESMGAATVMMAASKELPSNVKAVIEDCGYTSAYDMFAKELDAMFNLPPTPLLPVSSIVGQFKVGFDFYDVNLLEHLPKAILPILFIHGDQDDYVPTNMVYELYDAYPNEKELLIIEGAEHANSSEVNPELYYETVFKFINKYINE